MCVHIAQHTRHGLTCGGSRDQLHDQASFCKKFAVSKKLWLTLVVSVSF